MPIRRIRSLCCARAANGRSSEDVATLPTRVMNSRRFNGSAPPDAPRMPQARGAVRKKLRQDIETADIPVSRGWWIFGGPPDLPSR